jgi:hypothetical protein
MKLAMRFGWHPKGNQMKVGINDMGRIGRLVLRSAFGGIRRPGSDPRSQNRLDARRYSAKRPEKLEMKMRPEINDKAMPT